MNVHYDEELELFALGDLEESERAAVEAHIADCTECAAKLSAAEETIARMSSSLPAYRAPMRKQTVWRPSARVAVAAAFFGGVLAAALTLGFINLNAIPQQEVLAQIAMTHSHFEHVELTPMTSGAPAVKAIYARDRSWIYVITDNGRPGYRLLSVRGTGTPQDLGGLVAHGGSASLYVNHPPGSDELELVFNGQPVARGTLR